MTKSERAQVATVLREWAAWCEANPDRYWWDSDFMIGGPAWSAAYDFCEAEDMENFAGSLRGPVAATGLLLAAAAVESGAEI